MNNNTHKVIPDKIPFYRDVRFLKVFFQILFVIVVILSAGFFYSNMLNGLRRQNLELGLSFLIDSEAGIEISEGIDFDPSETFLKAFWVGVVNTLKVSILGIFCATVIGFFFGIARLSNNWLIRQIASVYIECFRNIPLILQIIFWYAIMLVLPVVQESIRFFDSIFINVRGVYVPSLEGTAGLIPWLWYFLSGIIITIIVVLGLAAFRYFFQFRERHEADRPSFISNIIFGAKWVAAPTFLMATIVGWLLTPEVPFELSRPELQGFNFVGGINFSPEFTALLIGLAVYTSAFIAEVVRSGIQAVVKGQREAARSVGLKESQVLRLVVVPQAIPVIVPPLTSQYLNLAKNSSLAIFIGFPDLFQVGEIMMNQTGQSIPIFAMIMVSYLIMSLTTSAFMNWYNHRITRMGRST
ncbi:ABC transporter permease subunit [Candidatus Poribacteria bacterium]|nr:ABC transporter permease subunit [Candidatus Poribacteria bacterium]MYK22841.1 ABC transporter permease subunit [Candidatus Poribacteria bacterium]